MVNLLIKNGVGTDENRSIFKNARGSLNEVEQRTLATALGLQIVSDVPVVEERTNMSLYEMLSEDVQHFDHDGDVEEDLDGNPAFIVVDGVLFKRKASEQLQSETIEEDFDEEDIEEDPDTY